MSYSDTINMKNTKLSYTEFKKALARENFAISITSREPSNDNANLLVVIRRENKKNKNKGISKLFEISVKDKNFNIVRDSQAKLKVKHGIGNRFPYRALSIVFASHILNHDFNAKRNGTKLILDKLEFRTYLRSDYYETTSNQNAFFNKNEGLKIIKDFAVKALNYPFKKGSLKIEYPPKLVLATNPLLESAIKKKKTKNKVVKAKPKKKVIRKKKATKKTIGVAQSALSSQTGEGNHNEQMGVNAPAKVETKPTVINLKTPTSEPAKDADTSLGIKKDVENPKDKLIYYSVVYIEFHPAVGEVLKFSDKQSQFLIKLYKKLQELNRDTLKVSELKMFDILKTRWHDLFPYPKQLKHKIFTLPRGEIGIKKDLLSLEDRNKIVLSSSI